MAAEAVAVFPKWLAVTETESYSKNYLSVKYGTESDRSRKLQKNVYGRESNAKSTSMVTSLPEPTTSCVAESIAIETSTLPTTSWTA